MLLPVAEALPSHNDIKQLGMVLDRVAMLFLQSSTLIFHQLFQPAQSPTNCNRELLLAMFNKPTSQLYNWCPNCNLVLQSTAFSNPMFNVLWLRSNQGESSVQQSHSFLQQAAKGLITKSRQACEQMFQDCNNESKSDGSLLYQLVKQTCY
jgi:hypothetical protein